MSKNKLSREQVIDLLEYLGSSKIINKESKKDIQFCCTVHGESNPSAGYDTEHHMFHCFSCHAKGTVEWLVMKSLPDEFKSVQAVDNFIKQRYGVDLHSIDLATVTNLRRYGEEIEEESEESRRKVLPLSFLAPFKSGKETYKYFYERGFTKQTVKDFKIGRDTINKTVTVPVFYEDNQLAGVIGRYISPNRKKNERYKIYEVDTGDILFPMNMGEAIDDTFIIVEGLLDSVYMHQLGFTNTKALLTNNMSKSQAEWLKKNCKNIIDMTDNDEMGILASNSIKEKLGKTHIIFSVKEFYPEDKKDPQELTKEEVQYMLDNKVSSLRKKLSRME